MKKRYTVLGLSLFLALALSVPALGGPSNPVASISASVKATANKALKKAKNAQKTANTALSTANSAQSLAGSAQDEAKKGVSEAKKAQTTANQAVSAAAAAQSTANSAKAAAEAAEANANSRLKTSQLALGTASASNTTAVKTASVDCPAGSVVLGGGAFINTAEPRKVHLVSSNPQAIYSQGWFVEGATVEGQTATWSIQANAMCGTR